MPLFTRDSFKYRLVADDTDAKARHVSQYSRLSWLIPCCVAVVAFGLGSLVGVFVLAPQASCATSLQQPPAFKPKPDIPLDVIEKPFKYNRTFGASPDSKGTSEAWESIIPLGQGTVRFPRKSNNLYTLSVVHQLHCLWSIHGNYYKKFDDSQDKSKDFAHMRHCFDYLRQSLLCASDASLEPVDPDLGGVTGWNNRRVCRDYQKVVDWAEDHRVSNLRGFMQTSHHH